MVEKNKSTLEMAILSQRLRALREKTKVARFIALNPQTHTVMSFAYRITFGSSLACFKTSYHEYLRDIRALALEKFNATGKNTFTSAATHLELKQDGVYRKIYYELKKEHKTVVQRVSIHDAVIEIYETITNKKYTCKGYIGKEEVDKLDWCTKIFGEIAARRENKKLEYEYTRSSRERMGISAQQEKAVKKDLEESKAFMGDSDISNVLVDAVTGKRVTVAEVVRRANKEEGTADSISDDFTLSPEEITIKAKTAITTREVISSADEKADIDRIIANRNAEAKKTVKAPTVKDVDGLIRTTGQSDALISEADLPLNIKKMRQIETFNAQKITMLRLMRRQEMTPAERDAEDDRERERLAAIFTIPEEDRPKSKDSPQIPVETPSTEETKE
jgi:hypothetical protein